MKRIAWIVFGWSAFMVMAQAASFDCEKASFKIEKMICGNVDLSKLDEDLSNAYKTALQDAKKSEPTRQAQKKWIKERNNCQDTACVILAYRTRISELTSNSSSTNSTNVSSSENVREIVSSTKATIVTAAQAKQPEYVYVANSGKNNVSAYLINAATGALTPVPGSPFATGDQPSSITVNPAGTFAFVPNAVSGNVSVYRINAATGALTPVQGSPFVAGKEVADEENEHPTSVAINPAGTFAYVVEAQGNGRYGDVFAYRINATTGALTPVRGTPFVYNMGAAPEFVEINPAGTFAYVAKYGGNGRNVDVFIYRINAATGALTHVPGKQPFFLSFPHVLMSNSAGTFVYVAYDANRSVKYNSDHLSNKITAYRVNTTTGELTPIHGSSFAADGRIESVTVNPAGTFLYVANSVYVAGTVYKPVPGGDVSNVIVKGNITAFRINSTTGALTPVPGGPFAQGKKPLYITINPTGTFAFVVTEEDDLKGLCSILAYHIDSTTGALTLSTSNSSSAVTIKAEDHVAVIQP